MRAFILFTIIALLSFRPGPTYAQASDHGQLIDRVETYLQNLKTAQAKFIQTAYNGNKLDGVFYIHRPGKLRFEYNDVDDFIVADGFFIYFYDSELQEQTNAPISQTIAHILLRENIDLDENLTVQNINETPSQYQLTVVKASDPDAGSLTLFFDKHPFNLKKWRVKDAQNLITEIELFQMKKDVDLDKNLFVYHDPRKFNGGPAYNE